MKRMIIFGVLPVVLLAAAGGGVFAYLSISHPHKPASVMADTPKPLLFAALSDVVVSVPADNGDTASSFVQFAVQFATTDPGAISNFTALQPIIKSEIINLLMNETGKSLGDPGARATLVKNCLATANSVLAHNGGALPAPFTAAYITNLVVQN